MVESVIADCCICSKFTAKLRLQVVIRVGRYCGHVGLVSLFSEEPPLFAVFAGNYQRQTIPRPQRCSISGDVTEERTAEHQLMPGLFVRSLRTRKELRLHAGCSGD
jgi:hypothetical protein